MKKNVLFLALFLAISLIGYSQKYHRITANVTKDQLELLFKNGLEADHFHLEDGFFFC